MPLCHPSRRRHTPTQFAGFLLLTSLLLGSLPSGAAPAPPPPHHGDDGFQNPHLEHFDKSLWELLRLRFFSDLYIADQYRQRQRITSTAPSPALTAPDHQRLQISWVGHSTFVIQHRGVTVLTDPIFSRRASPLSFLGPKRLVPMPISLAQLPPIDLVLISHNHYDHLDRDSIRALGNQPLYLVPLGLKHWFTQLGIAPDRVIERDWWQTARIGEATVTATPSQHWSGRGIGDRFASLWASWHIQIGQRSIWFGGDTGYNPIQFKEIGRRLPRPNIALIPIGAYLPRDFLREQHVDPDEAVQIHLDLRAEKSIGMHWATFQLSAEDIDAPQKDLMQAADNAKLAKDEFTTLAIGETVVVN